MTANEKRAALAAKYKTIIGRNKYSQPRRDYCFKKYTDGNYYSDCSSSVSYTYKECGFSFGILNTVGMYTSTKFKDVPVTIKSGIIQNPEILRVGDILLFAGTDTSRKSADYVGHVEMVGEISGKTVQLYGHGSGNPKRHEMNAYCKSRYSSKTSTKIGNKGLLKVRRFIADDETPAGPTDQDSKVRIKNGYTVNIRTGAGTENKATGKYAGGGNVYAFTETKTVSGTVWYHISAGWISGKYAEVI